MKNLYLLLLVLIGATQFSTAQTASQYYFKAKTGVALEDLSTGADPILGTGADGVFSGSLPFFPFTFSGVSYNTFSVSEDGVVILGGATYTPYPYDDYVKQTPALSQQTAAYPILLPWGEDLTTADGGVSYKIVGTAPSRKLVIQFRVSSAEDVVVDYVNKTFQVWLSEGSNQIQFVYGSIFSDWYNNPNIGVAAAADNFLSVNSGDNTVSSTVVYSNSGVDASKQLRPVSGTSYIFSPTAIVDAPPTDPNPPTPPVVAPVVASLSVSPEYTVAGQQRNTIYLVYGAQSVSLVAKVSGGNPPSTGYTYNWSPATGLSSTTAASPLASPKVTTTYKVTISDGNGNVTTQEITVYVKDARCGGKGEKIMTCRYDKGQYRNECVAVKDVADRLKKGSTLGYCAATASMVMASEVMEVPTVSSAIFPSPSDGRFTVQVPMSQKPTDIVIYDAGGRVVTQRRLAASQQSVQFDLANQPKGYYLVKMVSNNRVQTGKIIIQ